VVLAARDESALYDLLQRARSLDLSCSCFTEPDFDDQLTAIALMGDAKALTSSLPLALKVSQKERAVYE
jgi:hypothetical protein